MTTMFDTCFTDNLMFIMMCREVIMRDNMYKGCIVRHPAAMQATLGAYIDFWSNNLPLSVDSNAEPICAVSGKKIYIADEGEIKEATPNGEISEVVKCFRECQKANPAFEEAMELKEVVSELMTMIAQSQLTEMDLCGWQPFHFSAKISVLEYRISQLKAENNLLRLQNEPSLEVQKKVIAQYKDVFRMGETGYNEFLRHYRRKHREYRNLLTSIRSDVPGDSRGDEMGRNIQMTQAVKDAISWSDHCRFNALNMYFRELPQSLALVPVELINEVCDTHLQSPYEADPRHRFLGQ